MKTGSRYFWITLVFTWGLGTGALGEDWPQWGGPARDSIWREKGIVKGFPDGGLPVLWRVPVGGGYAGPALGEGLLILTDRQLAPETENPADPFARGVIAGTERVSAYDPASGDLLWRFEYQCPYTVSYAAGPRATPTIHQGKVYTLGAEGHLYCFEAKTGRILWSKHFPSDYGVTTPVWGFAGHPLVEGDLLICLVGGQDGSALVAFDKNSGAERWRALSCKEPGYYPPVIGHLNGERQLVAWLPSEVAGLDPVTGKQLWSHATQDIRFALTIPTPRFLGDHLFLTSFYNGSLMLKWNPGSKDPVVDWGTTKPSEKDTVHLNSIMSSPIVEKGHIYGVCSYGQLRCLEVATGRRVWETFEATTGGAEVRWGNAFLVRHENGFFLFNENGDLILAELSPEGYRELGRQHLLEPTGTAAGRAVVWSHPAFAQQTCFARNDKEMVAVYLGVEPLEK